MGSVQALLSGETAFYNHPDTVSKEMEQSKAPSPCYSYNTESRVMRIAKRILLVILFPVGISYLAYRCLQWTAACCGLLPAVVFKYLPNSLLNTNQFRTRLSPGNRAIESGWQHKRISIEVDGMLIDCLIVGKHHTLQNGRWMIASLGNGESYETRWTHSWDERQPLRDLLRAADCNAISFNCPGVVGSSGIPNKETITKASRAILKFVEEEIQAKEIVWYGFSIGGAIQAAALANHQPKEGVSYCWIKDRTFSSLAAAGEGVSQNLLGTSLPARLASKVVKQGIKLLGWNLDSATSSKNLHSHEIIIQTVKKEALRTKIELNAVPVAPYKENFSSDDIVHDGVISKETSLAYALLNDPNCPKEHKEFIGIGGNHCSILSEKVVDFLVQKIRTIFDKRGEVAAAAS